MKMPQNKAILIYVLISTVFAQTFHKRDNGNEIYEIRIYESAPAATKATLNEPFDRLMREQKNCFAQLETDAELDWIEFDSALLLFVTTAQVPSSARPTQQAILHLMCTSNKMRSIHFSVHVTRRNRHPPKFALDNYKFYAPITMALGTQLGHLVVVDHDPIIYNSQVQLSIIPNEEQGKSIPLRRPSQVSSLVELTEYWQIYRNGSIIIEKSMANLQLYAEYRIRILAVDFGSPQLFSITNVTIVPINFLSSTDYAVTLTAVDVDGEAPSSPHIFQLVNAQLHCEGECSPKGGVPMCYYGGFHKIEQYRDLNGLHCLCFDGYSSSQCNHIESCSSERSIESYGGVDWPQTAVNQSTSVLCPYNANGEAIRRLCVWDSRFNLARWENVTNNESSILVHLGVLANYAQRADQTNAGLRAVQRFLNTILQFPAFNPRVISAHFDSKIAEHVATVIDTVAQMNLTQLSSAVRNPHSVSPNFQNANNTEDIRADLIEYIREFGRRLPTPFLLESTAGGLQFKTWKLTLAKGNENRKRRENNLDYQEIHGLDGTSLELNKCYIHLPNLSHKSNNLFINLFFRQFGKYKCARGMFKNGNFISKFGW